MRNTKRKTWLRRLACGGLSAAMLFAALPTGFQAHAAADKAPILQSGKNYGGVQTDSLLSAAYTVDGGFVAMGYSMGASSDPEWTHSGSASNNDALLLKFDMDHKLQWAKAYGGTGVDVFNSVDVLKDGRIAALGRSSFTSSDSSIKGVSWYLLLINPNDPEDYVDYRIGGSAGDQGYGVAATSDGGFVVAGWTASEAGYLTHSEDLTTYSQPVQLWQGKNGTDESLPKRIAPKGSDSVVVKFDSKGQVQYTALHNYGVMEGKYNITSPSERLTDVTVDEHGNVYLVGYHSVSKSVQNAVVAKLNGSNGSLLWHRSAGRANDKMTTLASTELDKIKAEYNGVAVLKDGSVVVSGEADKDAASEEGWQVTGANDALWVHYSADGAVRGAQCVGTISYRTTDDIGSKHASVTAMPDGGFLFSGTAFGVMQEDDLIDAGYNWGNYGAQDGVMMKYSAANQLEWADNIGTRQGDWINSVLVRDDGELIVVGESNGKNGAPAWGNNGGIDGVIACSNLYPDAFTESVNTSADGAVVWADGTYSDYGDGHGGVDAIRVSATVEQGRIASLTGESLKETESYYSKAAKLYGTIVEKQSTDVDVITRATMSSNGILEATDKALGQAAAKHVDDLIAAIETADDKLAATQAAVEAYGELGTCSASKLTRLEQLQAAAQTYAVTLSSRADKYEGVKETHPEKGKNLRHNDTYFKLQNQYLKGINASALEKKGLNGEGVTIAVIDSGVTPAQQDLNYSQILDGWDYETNSAMSASALVDEDGHGTAVTGILTAKADNGMGTAGFFSKLKVVPLRVIPKKQLDDASSEKVAQAIMDAVDKYHVDVITTSLDVKDTTALSDAVQHAAAENVLITGASGNSSKEANNGSDPYVYPASYDEVISVGAVDLNQKVRASSQKNDKVFVTAPGEHIPVLDLSWNHRCKLADGTSYASPMVAALAVAAKQYAKDNNQEFTLEQFKTLLQSSSKDAGADGYDTSYGYGIIDCAAFVRALYNITTDYAVTLNQTELTLTQGESATLTAVVTPEDAENKAVLWSSSDEGVATVDETGLVSAVAPGTTTITAVCAADDTVSAECEVTVQAPAEPEPQPDPQPIEQDGVPSDGTWTAAAPCEGFGYSVQLSAVFENGALRELKDFLLVGNDDEDNEEFAEDAWKGMQSRLLNASGGKVDVVSGATHSSKAILAAYQDAREQAVQAKQAEEAERKKVKKVTISAKELTLTVGESATLSASVEPDTAENKNIVWESSDEGVVTVDESGTLTPVAAGQAVVKAVSQADESVFDACQVTVNEAQSEPEPEPEPEPGPVGKAQKQTISAKSLTKVLGDKAFPLKAKAKTGLSYESSDTKVVQIDKKGNVTIKGVGKAKITIQAQKTEQFQAAKKTVTITVNPKGTALKKVSGGKKKVDVTWNKNVAADGYQLQYAKDKAFKKGRKTVNIGKNSTVKTTVKKLKGKQKYFFRIRTFKKVGKTTYYSKWSGSKSTTAKK